MIQRVLATALGVASLFVALPATARGHGGGGGHHGGRITGFRTSKCVSAKCFRKHPNGTYVHPITARKHR